ncbi:MAG: hypothetical protein E6K52_09275 [Gammaproteobacteria bacterium]|nr:MAG: hypothetical protein E6K52_09275 [Gammaproteobacteria bacterium]
MARASVGSMRRGWLRLTRGAYHVRCDTLAARGWVRRRRR